MSGPQDVDDSATLESALATAIRASRLDSEAEQRALTAFRAAAHGVGARRARTRRRDDWRPPEERRVRRPLHMTFGVVFASLTLGGVAVAAIGSAGSTTDGAGTRRGDAHPSAAATDQPGGATSPVSLGGPGPTDRPSSARDTAAHCRAYEHVEKRGKALDARAWQRLVAAAGGKNEVTAYCSEQLRRAAAASNGSAGSGKPGAGAADARNGTAGGTGTPGDRPGGTDNATGNGRTSAGKGSGKHR
ncbi:hypothetical protein AB0L75_30480 [Streptomyces sp. NPDC052101]|uniref:hypothetical protein n=1 Tax=Streptomyces sp. NPDC052101 TaxID=3155763 RepID=UPI003419E759